MFRILRASSPVLFCLSLWLGASPASADEPGVKAYPECTREPTDGDVQAAKGAFQAGQAAFKEADYARAILYWEDAYRRDCTAHPLLLNLATAYELSGNKEQAIAALQTYLVRRSDAPDADQITRRIEVLKRQVEEAKHAAAPAPTPVQPKPAAAPPKPPADELPAKEPERSRPMLPLVVAGSGGAVAIVGVALWANARSDIKDLEKQCPTRSGCTKQVAEDGNSARKRQTIWGVTSVAGLAIAAGGTVWYFLSPAQPDSVAASHFTPVLMPGFAGFTLSSQF